MEDRINCHTSGHLCRIFLWIIQFNILDMGLIVALFIQYEHDMQNYTGLSNEKVIFAYMYKDTKWVNRHRALLILYTSL